MSALSHRTRRTAFASLVAAGAIAALPAPANAQAAIDHGVPAIPVNAPGTDVAAPDQQAPRPVVNARPQLGPPTWPTAPKPIVRNPAPVSPADPPEDSLPTPLVLALIALGLMLGGLGLASRLAVTRRRTRAAA